MSDKSTGPSSTVQFILEQNRDVKNLALCIIGQRVRRNSGKTKLASTEEGRKNLSETSQLLQDKIINYIADVKLSIIQYDARTCHASNKKKGVIYKKQQSMTKRDPEPSTASPSSSPESLKQI